MITVKVYLNQASHFRAFNAFRAELQLAVTFEIDATEPEFVVTDDPSLSNAEFDVRYRAARDEHNTWVDPILNHVYEQLNVGGDVFPAEPYTVEYRMAGNRSLSVGDLVVLEWDRELANVTRDGRPVVVHEVEPFAVEPVGFKRTSSVAIRKGVENFTKNASNPDRFVPVPRTDLAVNDAGMFVLKNERPEPAFTFEFVQEDLRNGL
jgi:hypothetical protein